MFSSANTGSERATHGYRDPEGRVRSAGTHATRRAAERAANREEQKVLAGSWRDASLGAISFRDYVEQDWLPQQAHRAHHQGRQCGDGRQAAVCRAK